MTYRKGCAAAIAFNSPKKRENCGIIITGTIRRKRFLITAVMRICLRR
jgi:hypothetical protein